MRLLRSRFPLFATSNGAGNGNHTPFCVLVVQLFGKEKTDPKNPQFPMFVFARIYAFESLIGGKGNLLLHFIRGRPLNFDHKQASLPRFFFPLFAGFNGAGKGHSSESRTPFW